MIQINKISKYFGRYRALDNVSCTINKGEIIGFLGQNGAGKTTLMRILTGFLPPSSGSVLIGNEDISQNPLGVRKRIGYLPETPPLYPQMSVKEYLKFAAQLKSVPAKEISKHLQNVINDCRLHQVENKIIAQLSLGYRQRVGIAQAIINDPEVLILDEPTKGLDPIQIKQVRDLIKGLKDKRTVILSTHILSEIEQIAQRVLMMDAGKIIADDTLSNLLAAHGGSLEEVFFKLANPLEK